MLDIYLSSVSNRMNAAMKVLTIIATIFIPLSFITGIFGMNFEHMPELGWAWAYPWGFWGVILAAVLGMVYVFKRNKWL
jgi:magnesium transporter